MSAVRRFEHIVSNVNRWIGENLVQYLILLMSGLVTGEVILRYVFNSPTMWSQELSNFVFGAFFILGGAYTLLHRDHVGGML